MKKKSPKFDAYEESFSIINTIIGMEWSKSTLVGGEYKPMTIQRFVVLKKKAESFIKKMDKYPRVKMDAKYDSEEGGLEYFLSNVMSGSIDINLKERPCHNNNGVFNVGVYREVSAEEKLEQFHKLMMSFVWKIHYFSDRWCYVRYYCFKMYWKLLCVRWENYKYLKSVKYKKTMEYLNNI